MKQLIISVPTNQDWIDVCKKIEVDYPDVMCNWGNKPTKHNYWIIYGEKSCLSVLKEDNNKLEYCDKNWYEKNNPDIPIISAKEFLKVVEAHKEDK